MGGGGTREDPPVLRSLSPETLGDSLDVAESQKTGLGGPEPLPPKHLSPPEARHQPEGEAEAEAEADQGEESPPGEREGRSRVKQRVGWFKGVGSSILPYDRLDASGRHSFTPREAKFHPVSLY